MEVGNYISAYRNTSSPEYAALQSQVVGELSSAYSAANGFSNVQIVEFWQDGENTVAWWILVFNMSFSIGILIKKQNLITKDSLKTNQKAFRINKTNFDGNFYA